MGNTNPKGITNLARVPLARSVWGPVLETDIFTDDFLAAEASWNDFARGGPGVWYNAVMKRRPMPIEPTEEDAQAKEDAMRDMEADRGQA